MSREERFPIARILGYSGMSKSKDQENHKIVGLGNWCGETIREIASQLI